MKGSDRILLDGLRSSVASHVPADHWALVEKAVEDAGDIRLIDGYAQTIVLDAIAKAKKKKNKIQTVMGEFKEGKLESSSGQKVTNPKQALAIALSEQQRAKKKKKVAKAEEAPVEEASAEDIEKASFASRSEAGRYAAEQRWKNQRKGGAQAAKDDARLRRKFMRFMDPDGPQASREDLQAFIDKKWITREQLNEYDRKLLDQPSGNKEPFLDLTDIDPQGKLESKGESKSSAGSFKESNLSDIASAIRRDLKAQGKKVPAAAKPYLDALDSLDKISDNYFADSGSSIVAYLLGNLSSYKGETARAIKAELNRRLKEEGANIDRRQAAQDTWARG